MFLEHFNLTAEPFSLTPDPAFLYLSPEHREALAAVQYGLVAGRGFVTLVGEVGTGKTTLLYSLLARTDLEAETAYVAYTTQTFEELLGAALTDLGVTFRSRSKADLLEALNGHLIQRAQQGRTVALVVDEAQDLSDIAFEELRLLSNFESYTRKLLQIVLVGQPELQERLAQPQLRQVRERVGVRAVINPLSRDEMGRYIGHRIARVGADPDALFEPRALDLIVRRTEGIARRANILCHNALLFAFGRGLHRVTAEAAREAIAEMDGRARRVRGRWRARAGTWGAAAAAAVVLGGAALVGSVLVWRDVPRRPAARTITPAAPAPVASAPRVEAPAARVTSPVQESPAAAADEGTVDMGRPARPAEPSPPPPLATNESMEFTVPPGTTLTEVLQQMYGRHFPSSDGQALLAEVQRLNPRIKDVDMILAGQVLRLPPRAR